MRRPMSMWRAAIILLPLSMATLACGGGSLGEGPGPDPKPRVLAAAVRQLVSVDHTFGTGPPPFTEYLLLSSIDPAAGHVGSNQDSPTRPLTAGERDAIAAAVAPFGPSRWIDDPERWRSEDLRPTIEGAVIIGVGEPEISDTSALVPMSLWCGGTCGTWLTYRVELVDGSWQVVGTEGPIAIS